MRPGLVVTLSSALFKSYFRASRNPSVSFFSRPVVMLVIDILAFVIPAVLVQSFIGALPADLEALAGSLVVQAMISLPLLMTSAVIVSGLMSELGQGSAVSSSEAVNWWPVSPREYVAASSLATSSLYSAFLALAAGFTLPLATRFGLVSLWPVTMLLSLLSLLLGSFIVEFLKAIMNRVSSVAYKKSGRLVLAVRLVALILLFSIIQIAFQPYFLYWFFGKIVAGIEVVWVIPFVWPSASLISLFGSDMLKTVVYGVLSFLFTVTLYEIASQLRRRYWSPVPISISIDETAEYIPRESSGIGFGFSPLASLLALKEFRALTRRKDLARFLAIPVVIAISLLLPTVASPGDMSGRGAGFFLVAFIPLIIPLMLATICIGQEGASIMNLLSLPVKPSDLIKGKLAPSWLISGLATLGVIAVLEILAPLGLSNVLATLAISLMAIVINSFIGLGTGARWPDYTVGSRSRFVTLKGFFVGFALSGLATLIVFAPVGLYIVTSGGVRGEVPFLGLELLPMLAISIALGSVLIVFSYMFCKKGVENLLSNA